jgi:16S rRNA (cytidine1402-2'-O)-methyltransferase
MAALSIVATPIGNLEDLTLRALRVLRECDVILCEDTRVTRKLLQKYEIEKPTISYHQHSGAMKAEKIFELLEEGKHLALVTDAGTPGVSDPGSELVRAVRERFGGAVSIVAVPGPSALAAAISIAGAPAAEFLFLGFLPHKKGRQTLFREIAASERTAVFYESPHRIIRSLEALAELAPEKQITIARELTKIHEEVLQGTAQELLRLLQDDPQKQRGEFVVLVSA